MEVLRSKPKAIKPAMAEASVQPVPWIDEEVFIFGEQKRLILWGSIKKSQVLLPEKCPPLSNMVLVFEGWGMFFKKACEDSSIV